LEKVAAALRIRGAEPGEVFIASHFYKTQLRPTLKRIDAYVIRWARRKFKRLHHRTKGARDWICVQKPCAAL
jgi:hypothetical protein